MLDLVAVGDVLLDVRLPDGPGRHGEIRTVAAGSAVNAARAAAALGARAAVVGAVGDDSVGKVVELELRGAGIDVHLAHVAGARTGTAVYGGGQVVADRGANALFVPEAVPPARATLVSAYLTERARARALELGGGIRAVDLQGVLEDAPGADVVIGPGLDLDALAPRHAVVCCTRGAAGAVAVRGGERAEAAPEAVLASAPVGTGDTFAAAFLLALADGLPLQECLRRGCSAAARLAA